MYGTDFMAKRIFFSFISLILVIPSFSQVGIGTVTPGAQLDVVTQATTTSERKGIQVDLNSTSTAQQNTFSLHLTNSSSPSLTAAKYGIFNNVSGLGTATRYGVYSEVFKPNSGATTTDIFGVYSYVGQSTGVNSNSYGFYADLTNANNTANIFGVYSTVNGTVANQDIYSGYFLGGKFAIGQTGTNVYVLPASRGTNGQIMQTDGSGNVSWVDTDSNNFSLVRVNLSANQILNTSGWQKITFDTTLFDTNSEFNSTDNRFVASSDGYYKINAGYHTAYQNNNEFYSIGVWVNNVLYQESSFNHYATGDVVRSINCIVSLNANDYVEIFVQNFQTNDGSNGANGVVIDSFTGKTFFEIQRIR